MTPGQIEALHKVVIHKKKKKKENPLVERSFRKSGAQWNHTIWHNNNFVECSSTEVRQQSSPILSKFFKQLFIRLLNEVLRCFWGKCLWWIPSVSNCQRTDQLILGPLHTFFWKLSEGQSFKMFLKSLKYTLHICSVTKQF